MNRPPNFLRRNYPLMAVYLISAAAALVYLLLILRATDGHFIYCLDDAYIHLAIAKHIVRDGVWGVTPYAFSSSSSSILWPILLAAVFRIFGVREILPFLIALAASAILMAILYREWMGRENRPAWALGMLIAWMLVLPFGPILFNGMETMLQVLAAVAFAAAAVRFLSSEDSDGLLALCLLAGLASAVRYEGCFIAAVVCLLLVFHGRWKAAAAVAVSSALPVIGYGLYSLSQGWLFLPNSLLSKYGGIGGFGPATLLGLAARPFAPVTDSNGLHLPVWQLIAVILLVQLLWRARTVPSRGLWDNKLLPAVIFLGVAVLHSLGITVEWFFRYQAYLNALGIWAIGCAGIPCLDWTVLRRRATVWIAAAAAAVFIAVLLAAEAIWKTPLASRNIWQQQYQMGLFLREFYPQERVAANDIGAIDFLADIRLVDIFGLASRPVMQAKLSGMWESDLTGTLDRLTSAEGARIAVLYDTWFDYNPATGRAAVPLQWVRVASWTIPENVVCGGATVTWYAVIPEEAPALRSALETFSARLPAGVTVQYFPLP
jgi:hypothetical protein